MTIAAAPATAAAAAEVGTAANENAVIPFRRDPATEALSVCLKWFCAEACQGSSL